MKIIFSFVIRNSNVLAGAILDGLPAFVFVTDMVVAELAYVT